MPAVAANQIVAPQVPQPDDFAGAFLRAFQIGSADALQRAQLELSEDKILLARDQFNFSMDMQKEELALQRDQIGWERAQAIAGLEIRRKQANAQIALTNARTKGVLREIQMAEKTIKEQPSNDQWIRDWKPTLVTKKEEKVEVIFPEQKPVVNGAFVNQNDEFNVLQGQSTGPGGSVNENIPVPQSSMSVEVNGWGL